MKKVVFLFTLLLLAVNCFSQTKIDSLIQLSRSATAEQKIGYYLEISLIARKDTAQSIFYAKKAMQLSVAGNLIAEEAKSIYYQGETKFYASDFLAAAPFYEKAIPLYEQVGDTAMLTDCYNSIGLCYHKTDLGERAISEFVKGLKLCTNDAHFSAKFLHNIGNVHKRMQNYAAAIEYFKKAEAINIAIKDTVILAEDYNSMGEVYQSQNLSDSALIYFSKARNLFRKTRQGEYEAITLANMGSAYGGFPDSLKKAHESFQLATIKFRELGINIYQPDILEGIGELLITEGRYDEAINTFNESLILTKKFGRGLELMAVNYNRLSEIYKKTGNFENALKYKELYIKYNDSLESMNRYDKIVTLEKQYETEKKENEIIKLQASKEITEIQLQKNRQLKQLGFISALILLAFAFYMAYRYFDKIRVNKELEEKNRKIEESEQELRKLNAAKNKFFSIIAHDLKNPLHTVLGYSDLLSKEFNMFTEKERQKFASDINHSTNNLYRLLQNLLDWSKTQTGNLRINPIETDLNQMIENSVALLSPMAKDKQIDMQVIAEEKLRIFADPLMLETVIRNLLNNAIKFTPDKGSVIITAMFSGEKIVVQIKDSGVGIPEDEVENLFKIDSKVKRKGTNNEDGSGLGLILCKDFIELNHGSINVKSAPGKGSTFTITIPSLKMKKGDHESRKIIQQASA